MGVVVQQPAPPFRVHLPNPYRSRGRVLRWPRITRDGNRRPRKTLGTEPSAIRSDCLSFEEVVSIVLWESGMDPEKGDLLGQLT
jgi:hypothetical protein